MSSIREGFCKAVTDAWLQELGAGVLEALKTQRGAIQRSQAALQDVDANVSQSQAILKRMGRWWPF